MKKCEVIEHAVFMEWKTDLCTILEIAIFWDMMLCSRVDRQVSVCCFCLHGRPWRAYSLTRKPNGRKYFEEVGTEGREILKWILTLWSLEYGRFLKCAVALSLDKYLHFRGACCLCYQWFRRKDLLLATCFMTLKFHLNAQKGKAVWKGWSQTGEMAVWSFSLPRSWVYY